MSTVIVNLIGIVFILCIVYWFWIFKPKAIQVKDAVTIIVQEGAYKPSLIRANYNTPIKITFLRTDPNPCAEYVVFDAFNISQALPLNQKITLKLDNDKKGTFEFTCQMGMYRGKLIVE